LITTIDPQVVTSGPFLELRVYLPLSGPVTWDNGHRTIVLFVGCRSFVLPYRGVLSLIW